MTKTVSIPTLNEYQYSFKNVFFNYSVMYHPGKIVKILAPKDRNIVSSDSSIQAVVRMWDENLFTFLIDNKIASKVKEDDVVFVDYTPMQNSPMPRHVVVKIVRGDTAKTVWDNYKKYYSRQMTIKNAMQEQMHDHDDYMG